MASIKTITRDLTLAFPGDPFDPFGCTCPKCDRKLTADMFFCPHCGQKIKILNTRNGDWSALLRDVQKIPDVADTDIVITDKADAGSRAGQETIKGVYLDRLKAYKNEHAQIEGQLSLF